jgi:deazaflavin-dependent oxidoreductase (nitroreductase family)
MIAKSTITELNQHRSPRFGGVFWWLARRTSGIVMPLSGQRWNPNFAVVEHRGRRSGGQHATPVAARRAADGFVIALAFGAQADWYRNLSAAGGGAIRWRGRTYPVSAPQPFDAAIALAAFHPAQRLALRLARIDGYIRVPDVGRIVA